MIAGNWVTRPQNMWRSRNKYEKSDCGVILPLAAREVGARMCSDT
jgi:hypothetical protein